MRNAVTDVEMPKRRDAEAVARTVAALCEQDSVFASRRAASGLSGIDYIHAVTAPARNAGTMPAFANAASYAAFVLTQPPLPAPPVPFAIVRDPLDGAMKVQQE